MSYCVVASSKRSVRNTLAPANHYQKMRSLPLSPSSWSSSLRMTSRNCFSSLPPWPSQETRHGTGCKWGVTNTTTSNAVPSILGVGVAILCAAFYAHETSKKDANTTIRSGIVQCSSSLQIDTSVSDSSSSSSITTNDNIHDSIMATLYSGVSSYLKDRFWNSQPRQMSILPIDRTDTGVSTKHQHTDAQGADLSPSRKTKGLLSLVESSSDASHSCSAVLEENVVNNHVHDVLMNMSPFDVSVRALRGGRLSMEDTYCVHNGGRFAGVFDGHGGASVSRYTSETIYEKIEKFVQLESRSNNSYPDIAAIVKSINCAFDEIEDEVLDIDEFQYQGSTAVAVYVHEDKETTERTIVSANVGDSRAVLSHRSKAIDLTRDHKPDDVIEKSRILAMGETIEWDSYSQVSRVKNLSLSRAIGDRFAKPVVSGEVEIKLFPINDSLDKNGTEDDFIILASDGLWDVMTSQNCVDFVNKRLHPSKMQAENMTKKELIHQKISRRQNMSRFIANEAVRRGSCDNICVVIIWLNPLNALALGKE